MATRYLSTSQASAASSSSAGMVSCLAAACWPQCTLAHRPALACLLACCLSEARLKTALCDVCKIYPLRTVLRVCKLVRGLLAVKHAMIRVMACFSGLVSLTSLQAPDLRPDSRAPRPNISSS